MPSVDTAITAYSDLANVTINRQDFVIHTRQSQIDQSIDQFISTSLSCSVS